MSTYSTIDFLAVWEEIHNPGFNRMEFQSVRNERGRLIITPKQWIEKTNAIGMTSKALVFYDYYRISMIAVDNPNIIKTLSNNQLFKIPWIHYYNF